MPAGGATICLPAFWGATLLGRVSDWVEPAIWAASKNKLDRLAKVTNIGVVFTTLPILADSISQVFGVLALSQAIGPVSVSNRCCT